MIQSVEFLERRRSRSPHMKLIAAPPPTAADVQLSDNDRAPTGTAIPHSHALRGTTALDAVLASRPGITEKLDALVEVLKQEGERKVGEIDPGAIRQIGHHLQNLTAALLIDANEPADSDSEFRLKVKALDDRLVKLAGELR